MLCSQDAVDEHANLALYLKSRTWFNIFDVDALILMIMWLYVATNQLFSVYSILIALQTFRAYRASFEEQKGKMHAQFSKVVEECVRDAVFLSSRNQELTDENQQLTAGV